MHVNLVDPITVQGACAVIWVNSGVAWRGVAWRGVAWRGVESINDVL